MPTLGKKPAKNCQKVGAVMSNPQDYEHLLKSETFTVEVKLPPYHWDPDYECYMPDRPHLYSYSDGSEEDPDMTEKELESLQKRMDRELSRRESLITVVRRFIKDQDLKTIDEVRQLSKVALEQLAVNVWEIVRYPRPSTEPPNGKHTI